jgi:hypothetical protein
MRRFWLENRNGDVWDLTSNNLDDQNNAFLANPDGLGIRTRVRSFEIENTTFLESITTQTQVIGGAIHFKDYDHFNRFAEFVGAINHEQPLKLYYSTTRQVQRQWYKRVLITELRKGEISPKTSTLEVRLKFECLSQWMQDHNVSLEILRSGNALTHPFVYPYTYAGNNLAIDIDNSGNLRTSCVVRVEGLTDTPTFRIFQNNRIVDQARYHLTVPSGSHLIVDSAPDTQRAELHTGNNTENVYYTGEKDYTYSNFIMIPEGKSTFVVSAHNSNFGRVTISYSIQRELI